MKSIFTYLLLILLVCNINAQQLQQLDCGSIVFGENLKEVKPTATLTDIIYDATSRNREGIIIDASDVILRSNALVASLHLLPKTDPSLDQLFDSVKIRVIISYKNIKDGVLKTKTQFLKIENTDKNSIGKDQIILENVDWASITVDSFYCSNPELVRTHFQFTTFIMGERNLKPNPTTVMIPPFFSRSVNKAYIGVSWTEVNWATMYDLEWTFVDKFDKNQTPVFRNNATRVRVDSTGYEIPSIFPEGKLFCRVRAVGKDEKNQIITNDWSSTSSALPINEAEIFEQNSKTYQHIATFSEEGKRKDMVSYFDGTSRTRQMVTKLNTDGNPALVAETYYDHEGRQAIVSLPAPYKPEPTYELVGIFSPGSLTASTGSGPYYPSVNDLSIGNNFYNTDIISNIGSIGSISDILDWTKIKDYYSTSPSLSYKSNFNLNESGKPFSKLDFDFLSEVDDCKTALVTPKMSQASGAGKYYSEANDFNSAIHNDFVPNANGYPYFQTIYTPDKTGRKEMAGMAGDELRIGGGHETKVTYVNPSQDELDRVFGNDVGYADNYLKVVTTDPNGQASVSYTNSKGQVIATALSGNNPDNLRPVEKDPIFNNTIDVVAQNNNLDYNFESSLATQSFYIDQDRTNVNINYTIDPASLNMAVSCETGRFCYDCVRNVTIELKDECGEPVMDKIIELGSITDTTSSNLARCNYTSAFTFNDNRVLNKGTYTITKKLSVNVENRDAYIDHFIKKDTACFQPTVKEPVCLPPPTCVECTFEIVENNNIKALKRNIGNNINCIYQCPENKKPVYDMDTYASLLRDMRPGGQYGCIDATSVGKFKISVFNTLNILRSNNESGTDMNFDYKHPFFPYLNADGSEAKINCNTLTADEYVEAEAFVEGGQRFVRPQSIYLQKLSEIWQESWGESLIPYHPEYAYLEWSNDNISAQNFNTLINNTVSYEGAVNNGFFPTNEVLNASFVNIDPYMSTNPTASTAMLTTLSAIGEGEHVYNIFEMTKQITVCDLPVYKTSRSALMACISGNRIENFTPEQKQFAWETFKGIYMGKRAVIIDEQRNAALVTPGNRLHGRLNNFCVDESSFIDRCLPCESGSDDLKTLLKKAQRKILHPLCWPNRAGTAVISTPDGRRWVTADEAGAYAIMDWVTCSNTCPIAFEFMTFVNAVAMQRTITDPFSITDYPSIKLPEAMIKGFANPNSTTYKWLPQVISSNKMVVDVLDKKDSQAKFEFSADSKVPWKDLKFFSCLNNLEAKSLLSSPSDGLYSISAFDQESNEYKLKLKVIKGLDFVNCSTIPLSSGIISIDKGKFYFSDPKNIKQKEPQLINPNGIKGRHKLMCCLKPSLKIIPARSCESTTQLIAQAEILALKIERAQRLKDSLTLAYNKKCMADVNEHLTVSFDQPIYHFTLF